MSRRASLLRNALAGGEGRDHARRVPGSFRDPCGFLFTEGDTLLRQVGEAYRSDYDLLLSTGLYSELVAAALLVPHEEVEHPGCPGESTPYKVLRPERIPFVSYPYEWCFSQLKDAALLTLDVQRRALARGLWLKDASAFNVQFRGGRAVFIDTLSLEAYPEGRPWVAYQQFCEHFLAPLALMSYCDVDLAGILRSELEGIPLPMASRLLPLRSRLRLSLLMHLHLHARAQRRHAGRSNESARRVRETRIPLQGLQAMMESLESAVQALRWAPEGTEWGDYYEHTNYSERSRARKEALVARWIEELAPADVWDLGANTGRFSRLASERGIPTVAFDIDPAAVEKCYSDSRDRGDPLLLPLRMNLANPTPALGWDNAERSSLAERGPADLALALALIHHLAIGRNVPLGHIASALARLGRRVVLEFVPKEDSQVARLLATRRDIFPSYTVEGFEAAFAAHFQIEAREPVEGTERILYRLARR
jgi:hypothetical protein